VELIWKPISLNCEFTPIPEMYTLLLRYRDFDYVGTRLETGNARLRKPHSLQTLVELIHFELQDTD
jgi:hypothetical protein